MREGVAERRSECWGQTPQVRPARGLACCVVLGSSLSQSLSLQTLGKAVCLVAQEPSLAALLQLLARSQGLQPFGPKPPHLQSNKAIISFYRLSGVKVLL